jgi:hypothetical protein
MTKVTEKDPFKKARNEYVGYLYYAKLFESNYDDGDHHKNTQGQFNAVFVPIDEDTLQQMKDDGCPEESMGYTMFKPFKQADDAISYKIKRSRVHQKVEDFSGPPKVFDWTEGVSDKRWDEDTDGMIGNGTLARIKLNIY